MKASKELLEFVKQTALLANTPAFLFNTVRDEESILLFSNEIPTLTLIEELKSISRKKNKSDDEIAMVYLIFVSLSFKNDYDISDIMNINLSDIEWNQYMLAYLSANIFSTTVESIYPPIIIQKAPAEEYEPNTIYQNINMGKVPRNAL